MSNQKKSINVTHQFTISNIVHTLLDKRQLTLTYFLFSITDSIVCDWEINDLSRTVPPFKHFSL